MCHVCLSATWVTDPDGNPVEIVAENKSAPPS
jgi:hypothetical protein